MLCLYEGGAQHEIVKFNVKTQNFSTYKTDKAQQLYSYGQSYTIVGNALYMIPDGQMPYSYIFKFDLSGDSGNALNVTWKQIEPKGVYSDACLTSNNGRLFVIGGQDLSEGTTRKSVEMYDIKSDKWTQISDLNQKRRGSACIVLNEQLYAIGGNQEGIEHDYETINLFKEPSVTSWKSHSLQQHSVTLNSKAISHNDDIILIGGDNSNVAIDTQRNMTYAFPSLKEKALAQGVIKVNNTVYVFGGLTDGSESDTIHSYTFKLSNFFLKNRSFVMLSFLSLDQIRHTLQKDLPKMAIKLEIRKAMMELYLAQMALEF